MAATNQFTVGVEVSGRTVLQVVEGMPDPAEQKARDILAEKGIEDPDPDDWYPHGAWLGTFEDVRERIGEATLREIGQTVVSNVQWPDDAETFIDGVDAVDRAYRANLRGGDAGSYVAERVDYETARVHCDTPHPCAFDAALVKATARAFAGEGVSQVREVGESCRASGGDACTYEVSWWGRDDRL